MELYAHNTRRRLPASTTQRLWVPPDVSGRFDESFRMGPREPVPSDRLAELVAGGLSIGKIARELDVSSILPAVRHPARTASPLG